MKGYTEEEDEDIGQEDYHAAHTAYRRRQGL